MPTPKKAATIDELTDQLSRSRLTIVADYRGLPVSALQGFRASLRPTGAELRVAKNTLTTIAAEKAGVEGLGPWLAGPTALVLGFDDPVQTAKVVSDFVRTSRVLTVRGAVMEGRLVSSADVEAIATLPSREELQAKLLGMLLSPMTRTVGVLSGPSRSLAYLLNARAAQLGGEPLDAAAD